MAGFDLSVMAEDVYNEAIVDVVGPGTMVSEACAIKVDIYAIFPSGLCVMYYLQDLHLRHITPRQLDFASPFKLVSTAENRTKVSAFVLYFDTFFTVTGDAVPPETKVHVTKNDDVTLAEIWPVGGKRPHRRKSSLFREADRITSFSTGPQSIPTHWKQTLFLLRDPIVVVEGLSISINGRVYTN